MMFDVFVSFRGTDTGRSFVSHLCHVLDRRRLRTFKHEEDDKLGNRPASSEVLQAIEESKIAVAIISENYASSVLCLDELEKIIECEVKGSLQVMPVFYDVDYPDLLKEAEKSIRERGNTEKVKRWSYALKSLTRISSHNSQEWSDDSDMIKNIVENVFRHWFAAEPALHNRNDRTRSRISGINELSTADLVNMTIQDARGALGTLARRYIFGDKPIRVDPMPGSSVFGEKYVTEKELTRLVPASMDRHMKAIYTLLDLELNDGVREIGIWGAVGLGKTTLARLVYEQISPNFQEHYYYTSMDYTSSSTNLLEKITRDIIMGNNLDINHNVVKAKLGHQKVLLIVDGSYYNLQRLTTISRWFGRGSRLIVVHKEKDFLTKGGLYNLYHVEPMRYDEALQFFSLFAFKQEYVPRSFYRLCARAVFIAGHLPLPMKVLGSFLHGKDVKEWELELCKLEASQDNWNVAVVSRYISGDFYQKQSITDRCIGIEDEGDEFPLYYLPLG